MKNICFISNFYFTYLWHDVSKVLQTKGFRVFWIVSNKSYHNFLIQAGVKEENILYINRGYISKPNQPVDDFQINELIYGDRVLRLEKVDAVNYLTNIQKPIYDFLLKNSVSTVLGELTWAHELLINRITRKRTELKCRFICPAVTRIPNKRFVFFKDDRQSEILEIDNNETINLESIFKVEKPAYLKNNDLILNKKRSLKSRFNKALRFLTGKDFDPNDPGLIRSGWNRFKIRSSEELNKETYRAFIRPISLSTFNDEHPYILYTLHKQPEASIDVVGRYYEDQKQTILNFWRILPPNWKLVVKEHSNAIGDRDVKFYKELTQFPNIILANANLDSYELIKKSKLVVSISGTIAYESALMGYPSIVLSPVFFRRLNYCKHISLSEIENITNIEDLISEIKNSEDNRLEFCKYIMKNSFNGTISDPNATPHVLEQENVNNLANAIEIAVKSA
ncbi:hypothetical protein [Emticicia soli]|uniref:Capsule polysaccharide biosynthesis protein n=1 Tax=Emticicia soli TaxID=2027878 RepID=A0ABW5J6N5_9BACT